MKQKICNPACKKVALGTAAFGILSLLSTVAGSAAADGPTGWDFYAAPASVSTPASASPNLGGAYGGHNLGSKNNSGIVSVINSPVSCSASASMYTSAISLPGTSASASATVSANAQVDADWYVNGVPSNAVPTTGFTYSATALMLETSLAGACFSYNAAGAIVINGSATAGTTSGTSLPGDSSIGLPTYLQADSGTGVDPGGSAVLNQTYTPGYELPPESSSAFCSYHERGGAYIYQGGSLAWGENVDTALYQWTMSATYTVSYFQSEINDGDSPNVGTNIVAATQPHASASSASGAGISGAATDVYITARASETATP